jgi:hypothetical protein
MKMKQGKSLQELYIELFRLNSAKRDFVVDSGNMSISNDALRYHLQGASEDLELTPSELFHRQLGAALNIPAKYYDYMRTEYPQLLAENINGWFGKSENKRHLVRTLDGTARAFLSDRYRRIDNYEIAENVLPIIGDMPAAQVESCEVTDNRMYLKVVNPRLEAEVTKGDIVQAGIVISNSEVGLGSVCVAPLIYRLVCSNGMIAQDSGQRKYHVGRQNESDWEIFSDETLQLDDRAFMAKLQDIVHTAVDAAKFAIIVDKLREAVGLRFSAPITGVVEVTGNKYGFTKSENDGILRHLIEGGDLSLWGLSNAVTRTAADSENYDRATSLESVGWQIATMSPQIWREINTV